MDKTLVQKKLRGYQLYNEREQQEERRQLPKVTMLKQTSKALGETSKD